MAKKKPAKPARGNKLGVVIVAAMNKKKDVKR